MAEKDHGGDRLPGEAHAAPGRQLRRESIPASGSVNHQRRYTPTAAAARSSRRRATNLRTRFEESRAAPTLLGPSLRRPTCSPAGRKSCTHAASKAAAPDCTQTARRRGPRKSLARAERTATTARERAHPVRGGPVFERDWRRSESGPRHDMRFSTQRPPSANRRKRYGTTYPETIHFPAGNETPVKVQFREASRRVGRDVFESPGSKNEIALALRAGDRPATRCGHAAKKSMSTSRPTRHRQLRPPSGGGAFLRRQFGLSSVS